MAARDLAMDKQQLHKRLEELHAELQQVDSVDAGERETLQQLRSDIQELLAQKEGASSHQYKGLAERLREDIEQLEASHPQATLLMGQVIDLLAKIGI
jgi:DNA repair exonuclease SbcCD ATPase subunit